MIRAILLALLLACGLSACATQIPPTPVTAAGQSGISGAATIALWGTWEWEIAPAYTRLAMLRKTAARQLEAGRISKATAQAIQAGADRARALLDGSRRGNAAEPTPSQRAAHDEALRTIDIAESLLEH